jgi:hypothetical protein
MNLFREILLQKLPQPHFLTKNRVYRRLYAHDPHYNMQGGKALRTRSTRRRHRGNWLL